MGLLFFIFLFFGFVLWVLFYIRPTEVINLIADREVFYNWERPSASLSEEERSCLINNCVFYRGLSTNEKTRFEHRVAKFIQKKEFHLREDLLYNNKMPVLIAAAACTISFRLKKYKLKKFKHIIIYPDAYYSRMSDSNNAGEVNLRGYIVFSWRHFEAGNAIATDGLNVGIHEMAHAISFENIYEQGMGRIFEKYYKIWNAQANYILYNWDAYDTTVFRDYASTNIHELFAVCIELFFEKPEELKGSFPELHFSISKMLNYG